MKNLQKRVTQVVICLQALVVLACSNGQENVTPTVNLPVIEGLLKTGNKFRLQIRPQTSYSVASNSITDRVDTLHPYILTANSGRISLNYSGNGLFESDTSQLIQPGQYYQLFVTYNGQMIEATAFVPDLITGLSISSTTLSVPDFSNFNPGSGTIPSMPDPIDITWTGQGNDYYLLLVECLEADPDPIFDSDLNNNRPTFRVSPVQANGLQLRFQQFTYLGNHRVVVIKSTAEYAALYRETSVSSQSLVSPSTSIKNAFGIFTGYTTDTLYVKVKKS